MENDRPLREPLPPAVRARVHAILGRAAERVLAERLASFLTKSDPVTQASCTSEVTSVATQPVKTNRVYPYEPFL